jgi:hypothetical protein
VVEPGWGNPTDNETVEKNLNILGMQGWELVTATSVRAVQTLCAKRPMP